MEKLDLDYKFSELAHFDRMPDYMVEFGKPEMKRLTKKYTI